MRLVALLSACFLLVACGAFGSIAELQSQSSAATDALEKDLGVKPFIGWHYHNGSFTSVEVTFEAGKVEGMGVGELETHVQAAVAASFKDKPQRIVIAIAVKP